MDRITYTRGTYSKEAQKVELEVREDMDIFDFKILCKRLAASLGYSYNSIEEAFDNKQRPSKTKQILKD
tara:strand:- start:2386 stop:2592 length:207 start_codon:yes stop_codon:yes gene_type:complete